MENGPPNQTLSRTVCSAPDRPPAPPTLPVGGGRQEPLAKTPLRDQTILESEPVRHMIQTTWNALPHRFPTIELDEFVIMPNHVHGIIWIVGAPLGAPQIANPGSKQGAASSAPTLARVIRAFKSISAIAINQHFHRQGNPVWQRNYYEHIIRTEEDLNRIRQYIQDNSDNWEKDTERVKLT